MCADQTQNLEKEVVLKDDDLIVSKTDKKGKITYANRSFMQVSGYSEQMLLGEPHNLIRHSDMPRGAFRLMWKMLQNGEEFFAFVKNRCLDGSYYWVFANVTADLDEHGEAQGYFSVRRKPPRSALPTCEELYRNMRDIEARHPGNDGVNRSMAWLLEQVDALAPSFNEAMIKLYQQGK
ncbi:Aerotaxis receptor [Marinomonas aquimarina]|uniref:Aerotaxis receptor n=1 Tax=Marinomonas aquimarina TaxID=295068 RepID=A0A1A8T7B5_9GAMM|nr:PAS domain-containing protein [Marinomonas aquimarina]SBS27029.1 Aerotaxis receptor [Marinomonas aquimarina]